MINAIGNAILTSSLVGAISSGAQVITDGLKMWLPFENSDILGKDLTKGYDFTSGWTFNSLNVTIIDADTFTTSVNGYGIYKSYVTVGKTYKLTIAGTTTSSTGIKISDTSASTIYYENSSSGSFSDTVNFTVLGNTDIYLINKSTGETTITTLKVEEVSQFSPDISGNSNNASLLTAKYLDLNSDATKNNSVDFNGTTSGSKGSFALWFRRDATWGTTTSNHLVDFNSSDSSQRLIIAFQYSEGYKLNVYSKNGGSAAWGDDSFVTVSDDVWYRLVVTIDGTTLKCYLNGVQVGNTAFLSEGLDISNATNNFLAASLGGANSHFIGNMSNFQVWNEVWSDADVLFDYNNPNGIVTDNPSTSLIENNIRVWMPLNEGSGDFCVDNVSAVSQATKGIIKTDGQTIEELWSIGQDSPSPQLAMQDLTIGSNELKNTFNSNTDWTLTNLTVVSDLNTPAKGYNGQKVTRIASGLSSDNLIQDYTADTAGDVCVSVYIKSGSFTEADAITSLALRKDSARSLWGMNYDWSTGTTSVRAGSPSINNMTSTDVGGGWYRLSFSVGGFSVSDALIYELYPDIENSTAGNGIYFFGPQLEYGENPTAVRLNQDEGAKDNTTYTTYYKESFNIDVLNTTLRSREKSFNADGRGWAQVADNSTLDFGTGAFTMECWVKAGYTKQSSVLNTIFCLGNAVSATNSGGITTHENGKFIGYVAGQTMSADSTWTKGNWYHLVLTRNGSGLCTLYVDTTAQTDTETTTDTVTNTGDFSIGRDSNTNRYYANLISDIRCYDVALTQEQIQQNYDAGTAAHSN